MIVSQFLTLTKLSQENIPARVLKKDIMKLRVNETYKMATILDVDHPELVAMMLERRCRNCGCTQDDCSQCIEKTGGPCHWVEKDLCSACE